MLLISVRFPLEMKRTGTEEGLGHRGAAMRGVRPPANFAQTEF